MGFLSGTVTFSRFCVIGGSPKRLDENLLDKFRDHRIGKQRVARSNHEDVGWLGGRHLLDAEFDIEKNVLLDCLHLGMRIDASIIPPDLLRAYVQQELDALYKNNGNGRMRRSVQLKRRAVEAARDRADREIKAGHYRRLKQIPILWDTRNDLFFFGTTANVAIERLHPLMKTTFGKRLEPITSGTISHAWAERQGIARRLENLEPAAFVPHGDGDPRPEVYWTAHDATCRDFLGNEFLLWLWYTLCEKTNTIRLADESDAAVVLVKHLTLECPRAETGKEVITCEGPTQLPESRRAVRSGKLPRRLGLLISRQNEQYDFTLQAETFNISSAALPPASGNGNGDFRARAEERIEQVRHLSETVDLLFGAFLRIRLSSEWSSELRGIQTWLRAG